MNPPLTTAKTVRSCLQSVQTHRCPQIRRRVCCLVWLYTGLDTQKFCVKLLIFSYPYFFAYVLGAQKNRLIETVLLNTHNICFG